MWAADPAARAFRSHWGGGGYFFWRGVRGVGVHHLPFLPLIALSLPLLYRILSTPLHFDLPHSIRVVVPWLPLCVSLSYSLSFSPFLFFLSHHRLEESSLDCPPHGLGGRRVHVASAAASGHAAADVASAARTAPTAAKTAYRCPIYKKKAIKKLKLTPTTNNCEVHQQIHPHRNMNKSEASIRGGLLRLLQRPQRWTSTFLCPRGGETKVGGGKEKLEGAGLWVAMSLATVHRAA